MKQLIDKAAVVAKIEKMVKRLEDAFDNPSFASYEANLIAKGGYRKLKDILSLFDTFEMKEVDLENAFIDKACEWLKKNRKNYSSNALGEEYLIDDFKKAMKGE